MNQTNRTPPRPNMWCCVVKGAHIFCNHQTARTDSMSQEHWQDVATSVRKRKGSRATSERQPAALSLSIRSLRLHLHQQPASGLASAARRKHVAIWLQEAICAAYLLPLLTLWSTARQIKNSKTGWYITHPGGTCNALEWMLQCASQEAVSDNVRITQNIRQRVPDGWLSQREGLLT